MNYVPIKCSRCDCIIENPTDEFGDYNRPLCWSCFINQPEQRPTDDIDRDITDIERYLSESRQYLSDRSIGELEKEIIDLENESNMAKRGRTYA